MTLPYKHRTLAIAASLMLLGAAGCGTADEDAADAPGGAATSAQQSAAGSGDGKHAQHKGESGDSDADEMAGMETLATSEQRDLRVELHAMPPETFFVSEGDELRRQTPTGQDDVHLMVTVADRESGVRLPDVTVTARVADASGATSFEGPLYPMVGRGMGLHYGENVQVGRAGAYELTLTIGPPRVGRHRAVAGAWRQTIKVTQKVAFDGKALRPA